MIDSVPPEVFLDAYPAPMRDIAEAFRRIVRQAMPGAVERVRPGWRVVGYDVVAGRRSAYFCWIMPEPVHVHLGFVHGILMDDPDGLLQGTIPRARWVTAVPDDQVDSPKLQWLVREAARVALLSPAERRAAAVDRELTRHDLTERGP
jgi:hypothetical protein